MDSFLGIVWTNAACATALAVAVALAGRVIRRPAIVHAMWVFVLLELVSPPIFDVGVLPRPELRSPTEQPSALAIEPAAIGSVPRIADHAAEATGAGPADLGILLWLGGLVFVLFVAGRRCRRFQRLVRRTETVSPALQAEAAALASRIGLRRCPRIRLVPARVSPMVWFRPGSLSVLVPSRLLDRLSRPEREALLVHELAHVRRRDHWVRYFELLVGSIFWWHPVAWWARRSLRRWEERCCDGWVLRTLPDHATAYARALVKTVEFVAGSGFRTPALASGVSETGSLKERLTMIMKRRLPGRPSTIQRLLLLAAAAAALLVFPTWIDRPQASSGSDEEPSADLRHREELRELEREALELEAALERVRARQMELELEWQLSRSEAELGRLERAASELETAGREEEAELLGHELSEMRRQMDLERRRAEVRLDHLRRASLLELSESRGEAELLQREAQLLRKEAELRSRTRDRSRLHRERAEALARELREIEAQRAYEEALRLERESRRDDELH